MTCDTWAAHSACGILSTAAARAAARAAAVASFFARSACRTMSSEMSTPTIDAWGSWLASSRVNSPEPHPTSSTRLARATTGATADLVLRRRQQSRAPLYEENSAIYVSRVHALRRSGIILGDKVKPIVIDPIEALDINTAYDFWLAESLILNATAQPTS